MLASRPEHRFVFALLQYTLQAGRHFGPHSTPVLHHSYRLVNFYRGLGLRWQSSLCYPHTQYTALRLDLIYGCCRSPVMLAEAESQRQGAAAAAAISDREVTCTGGYATLPPCHPAALPYSVWALAQRIGQGLWSISYRQHFLLGDVWEEAYSGHTGPQCCSKFQNYGWEADVK